jgi:hypothetical protein
MVKRGCVMQQRNRVKKSIAEKPVKTECHHFWVIEVANGPSSFGTCKYCGETREFLNAFPTINPLRKNGHHLKLTKLSHVQVEKAM